MNVSEYIMDYFYKKGVNTAFMVTGGQAMWLNDAVGKHGGYDIICTHHEQSAAMSADAYGRINNKPALTIVTAGPGAVNAINGVVGGYTDSSPMIVISGQATLSYVEYQKNTGIRQFGVQGIFIEPLVKSVVKYFITIDDPKKIKYYLDQAYHFSTSGRPGPVWIDVPLDIQSSQVDESVLKGFVPNEEKSNAAILEHSIQKLLSVLKTSKRPLFLAGQGISLSKSRDLFMELLTTTRIPVVTSRLGIDLIESENELYVGRPGNYGERAANMAIQNSDLIISIGCRLASSLVGHNPKQFGMNAFIYVVDIDEKELYKPGPNVGYRVKADCKEFIKALLKTPLSELPDYKEWMIQCNLWKQKYPVVSPEYKMEKPVNSYYFVDRLSSLATSEMTILCDTGSCFHVSAQTWKVKKDQKYLTNGGLSSMGYWVAGIGACLATNRGKTIVITGDGSLQMNIQEFATIKCNNLPIKVFIINNNGYLLIRHTQHNFMENRFIGEGPNTGVWCPDSEKIAAAYGIDFVRIDDVSNMEDKIKRVLDSDDPVICEVMTPEWQLLMPRISSEKLSDGTLRSRDYDDMFPYLSEEELKSTRIGFKEK